MIIPYKAKKKKTDYKLTLCCKYTNIFFSKKQFLKWHVKNKSEQKTQKKRHKEKQTPFILPPPPLSLASSSPPQTTPPPLFSAATIYLSIHPSIHMRSLNFSQTNQPPPPITNKITFWMSLFFRLFSLYILFYISFFHFSIPYIFSSYQLFFAKKLWRRQLPTLNFNNDK